MNGIQYTYEVAANDLANAGSASTNLKKKLKKLQIPSEIIRRIAIAMYEGEINMVIHANGGIITATIEPDRISLHLKDQGPGIADIEKAMQEGYSTASEEAISLGFGAGMGLPNMKKSSDSFQIFSEPSVGTTVHMTFMLA